MLEVKQPDLIHEVSICRPSPALDTNVFKSRLPAYTTRLSAEHLSASILLGQVACTYKFSQKLPPVLRSETVLLIIWTEHESSTRPRHCVASFVCRTCFVQSLRSASMLTCQWRSSVLFSDILPHLSPRNL